MTTLFETIKRRRSIGRMTEQCPSREQIERLLEAATHAPNHHAVEPWKFFVLAGKARNELGAIMENALAERLVETHSEKAQGLLEKERAKPLRSPIIIVVVAEAPRHEKVVAIENVMAASAAVQNMLLTAEEMGLACVWRTGDAAYCPQVKRWLGLASDEQIVALVYTGYPAISRSIRRPQSAKGKTNWIGWHE